jgi:hypothetical protein
MAVRIGAACHHLSDLIVCSPVEYPEIAKAIQKVLDERGIHLPACHFHTPDVELVRYAITVGLLTARTPEERYQT